MTSRALVGLALLAGCVLAQIPDTLGTRPMPTDTAPADSVVRVYRPVKSPGTAVLLSLVLPGGGQVYTGTWWQAAIIAPAEVTLGYLSLRQHLSATESLNKGDTAGYTRYSNKRTVFLWWTGAVVAFSMADAYVSAQMYGFDREVRLTVGPGRAGIAVEF